MAAASAVAADRPARQARREPLHDRLTCVTTAPPAPGGFAPPGRMPGRRPSRPSVLDAARTAAIPLRPLTLIEVLDAAFVVLRKRPQAMFGLPFLVAAGLVVQALGTVLGTALLGEQRGQVAQIVFALFGWLALSLVAVVAVMWVNAILTRVSLEVLLGPGFAPAPVQLTARTVLRATPGVLLLALLELVASWLLQTGIGVLSYAFTPFLVVGDPTLAWIGAVLMLAVLLFATCWGASYLGLAVPAYMVENARTPGWIGKPYRPTNVLTAFGRAFQLIGLRNAHRASLVLAGGALICMVVAYLSTQGFYLLLTSLVYTFDRAALDLLAANPWVVIGVLIGGQLLGLSVSVAYLSALQTALYLDLRMRREGLDLALRFDGIAIPQPSAPVLPRPLVYLPPGPPPASFPPQAQPPYAGQQPGHQSGQQQWRQP